MYTTHTRRSVWSQGSRHESTYPLALSVPNMCCKEQPQAAEKKEELVTTEHRKIGQRKRGKKKKGKKHQMATLY